MGGGSIPDIRNLTDPGLIAAIPRMKPIELPGNPDGQYALAEPDGDCFVYATSGEAIRLDLTAATGEFQPRWLDPSTGRIVSTAEPVAAGAEIELTPPSKPRVLWLARQ
jgi:hypothetical protein